MNERTPLYRLKCYSEDPCPVSTASEPVYKHYIVWDSYLHLPTSCPYTITTTPTT